MTNAPVRVHEKPLYPPGVENDLETSPLDQRDKAMDVGRVRAAGWDDEAIYYAIAIDGYIRREAD